MTSVVVYEPAPLAYAAAFAVAGLLIAVAGTFGARLPSGGRPRRVGSADSWVEALPVALIAALAVYWATKWPVLAFFAFLVGINRSLIFGAAATRDLSIERTEAVAKWIDSLRDSLAASGGIEQALQWSTKRPHPLLKDETRNLTLDLQHQSTVEALSNFAGAVAHPSVDRTVAMLTLSLTRRAGGLTDTLAEAARQARNDASADRQVETSRSRMYAQARLITIGTTGVIVLAGMFRDDARAAYNGFTGQVVLTVILIGIYGTLMFLMWKGLPRPPLRPLSGIGSDSRGGKGSLPPSSSFNIRGLTRHAR